MRSVKKVPHQELIRQKRGQLRKLVKVTVLKFVAKKNLQYNPMLALWLPLPSVEQ